ncbi:DUF7563 family protein [Haladaptatus halobius]
MSECDSCGSFVAQRYARLFTPEETPVFVHTAMT